MSLQQVVRAFTRHGIADATQITEHISFLMLAERTNKPWRTSALQWSRMAKELASELEAPIPEPPSLSAWEGNTPRDLIAAFEALLENLDDDWGSFYQQEARFHLLSSDRPGEYYPTPHHIAAFLSALILQPEYTGTVYDPTCGSAGLLVAARRRAERIHPIGTDYNSRWASLGATNLYLNGVERPTIEPVSAISFREARADTHYEYVLMNPPFAAGVVESLVELAIKSLAESGRGALLVPSGVVQRRSETLLEGNHLVSIITLPEDAMQPYNGIRAHVVLLNKEQLYDEVWLASLLTDGYGTGRGRPLNEPEPPHPSELPRTLSLIQALREDTGWATVWQEEQGSLIMRHLDAGNGHPQGVALQVRGHWKSPRWQLAHWEEGALVWLGDSSPLNASVRLWIEYGMAGRPLGDDTEYAWVSLEESAQTGVTSWEIGDSSPKVTVDLEDDLLLIGRHDLTFIRRDQAAGYGACLLNDEGQRVTVWYWLEMDEPLPTGLTSLGQPLFAVGDTPAAYLFSLAADDEASTLLLTTSSRAVLWQAGDKQVGLLWHEAEEGEGEKDTAGVWRVADRLVLFGGERVNTTSRVTTEHALGIAFGPHADSPGGARLFAICLTATSLREHATLEPEHYLPELREAVVPLPPNQILASIRRHQDQLSRHVDWLLQMLTKSGKRTKALPTKIDALQQYFDGQQRKLWEHVQSYEHDFQQRELVVWGKQNGFSEPEVLQQLELLVLLGWVVPVHQDRINKYRLARPADMFEVSTE